MKLGVSLVIRKTISIPVEFLSLSCFFGKIPFPQTLIISLCVCLHLIALQKVTNKVDVTVSPETIFAMSIC